MEDIKKILIGHFNKLYFYINENLATSVSIAFSLVWTFGVFFILLINLNETENNSISKLSSIGSYLSGAFSPLAFYWLIYGYLLQNNKLKSEIKQLKKAEYDRIKSLTPIFNFTTHDSYRSLEPSLLTISKDLLRAKIINHGGDAFGVHLMSKVDSYNTPKSSAIHSLPRGSMDHLETFIDLEVPTTDQAYKTLKNGFSFYPDIKMKLLFHDSSGRKLAQNISVIRTALDNIPLYRLQLEGDVYEQRTDEH